MLLFITCYKDMKVSKNIKKQQQQSVVLIIMGKMTVSVLMVSVVFLLSVSEVISQCPPSSGKTLDVYNNNCIGFYRYLPDA